MTLGYDVIQRIRAILKSKILLSGLTHTGPDLKHLHVKLVTHTLQSQSPNENSVHK